MVPTPRRPPGLHRVLHIHWHVVSKRNPSSAAHHFSFFMSDVLSYARALFLFRGVGCIFYEMITGRPLFPGSTVEDELHLIFRILGEATRQNKATLQSIEILHWITGANVFVWAPSAYIISLANLWSAGTPTEETWPGITTSEEFKTYKFPLYQAEPLVSHAPRHVVGISSSSSISKICIIVKATSAFSCFLTQDRQRWSGPALHAPAGSQHFSHTSVL